RHVLVDGGLNGPPSLSRVFDPSTDVGETGVSCVRVHEKLEQPGPHHAPVPPDAGDLRQIEIEVGVAQDLEALAVRGEQAVLDPVVDHLDEMAGSGAPDVGIPTLGSERLEHRLHAVEHVALTADHQAVAVLEPPDPAGRAAVQECDALGFQLYGAADRPLPDRILVIDYSIAQ